MKKQVYNITFRQKAFLVNSYLGVSATSEQEAIKLAWEAHNDEVTHPDVKYVDVLDENDPGEVRVILTNEDN